MAMGKTLCRIVLFSFLAACAFSQDQPSGSRLEQMGKDQDDKVATLKDPMPDRAEAAIDRALDNIVVRSFLNPGSGWGLQFGGLYPGSSFALGPKYTQKGLLKENMNLTFSAAGSVKLYYTLGIRATFPHLANDHAVVDIVARRMDAPQVDYYGQGNNSNGGMRTNYRLEDVLAAGKLGYRPFRRKLTLGVVWSWSRNNVGPGTGDTPSTDTVFTPAQAPGIDHQTRYATGGPYIEWDTRDYPLDPHRGTHIAAAYAWHTAMDNNTYSFRQFFTNVEHYVPFWNEKRVLALRVQSNLTYLDPGHVVPIYRQATVGGPDDVRGLARFRYYDNNALIGNLEYRCEVAPIMDVAAFYDTGKVFHTPGDWGLSELHHSGGVGFRFKSRHALVMRVDVAYGGRGVKFLWTFSDVVTKLLRSPF